MRLVVASVVAPLLSLIATVSESPVSNERKLARLATSLTTPGVFQVSTRLLLLAATVKGAALYPLAATRAAASLATVGVASNAAVVSVTPPTVSVTRWLAPNALARLLSVWTSAVPEAPAVVSAAVETTFLRAVPVSVGVVLPAVCETTVGTSGGATLTAIPLSRSLPELPAASVTRAAME